MKFTIDNYTDFELDIDRTHKDEANEDDRWCKVSLRVKNKVLDYKIEEKEIFLEYEIENLAEKLGELLDGKLEEDEQVEFFQPDLEFLLYPSEDVEESIVDIRLNIIQDGVLSADYYNLCILKEDIEKIYQYLRSVIGEN